MKIPVLKPKPEEEKAGDVFSLTVFCVFMYVLSIRCARVLLQGSVAVRRSVPVPAECEPVAFLITNPL